MNHSCGWHASFMCVTCLIHACAQHALFVPLPVTHCNTLQHTATHCNTLQHTATHCNTLQHTATHYNTLQHTAPHCNTLDTRVTCQNHMCVWHHSYMCAWRYSFLRQCRSPKVTWLIQMCVWPHSSYVRHCPSLHMTTLSSDTRVTCHIHMCAWQHSYMCVWQHSYMRQWYSPNVTRHIHMPNPYVCVISFIYVYSNLFIYATKVFT